MSLKFCNSAENIRGGVNDFIIKDTSSMGRLIIKPVSKNLAKEIIIQHHYSHKWNDASFGILNYGIYRDDQADRCLGVAVYGYMKNPKARIFTHPNPNAWMCELNRMWIDDELGHNAESILIAASIKLLRRTAPNCVAVQSFADGRLGCGTIYKASNFKYYGFHHTIFMRSRRTGEVIHQQNFTNSTSITCYLRANIGFILGDFDAFKVRTYRYIYPLDKRFNFHKPPQEYPAYHKGEENITWRRDKFKIIDTCVNMLYEIKSKP